MLLWSSHGHGADHMIDGRNSWYLGFSQGQLGNVYIYSKIEFIKYAKKILMKSFLCMVLSLGSVFVKFSHMALHMGTLVHYYADPLISAHTSELR